MGTLEILDTQANLLHTQALRCPRADANPLQAGANFSLFWISKISSGAGVTALGVNWVIVLRLIITREIRRHLSLKRFVRY